MRFLMMSVFASLLLLSGCSKFQPHQVDLQALHPKIETKQRLPEGLTVEVETRDLRPDSDQGGRLMEIPVWYDRSVGPELAMLAARCGVTDEEIVRRHSGRDYQVFALGFAPGFAFMGLVEESLASPRLATPRKRVAAGSVGIAERQTAAYPALSPGGWNLIGRTPAPLFDRQRDGYSLLQPGDRVRFVAIGHDEFLKLGGDDTPLEEQP